LAGPCLAASASASLNPMARPFGPSALASGRSARPVTVSKRWIPGKSDNYLPIYRNLGVDLAGVEIAAEAEWAAASLAARRAILPAVVAAAAVEDVRGVAPDDHVVPCPAATSSISECTLSSSPGTPSLWTSSRVIVPAPEPE